MYKRQAPVRAEQQLRDLITVKITQQPAGCLVVVVRGQEIVALSLIHISLFCVRARRNCESGTRGGSGRHRLPHGGRKPRVCQSGPSEKCPAGAYGVLASKGADGIMAVSYTHLFYVSVSF